MNFTAFRLPRVITPTLAKRAFPTMLALVAPSQYWPTLAPQLLPELFQLMLCSWFCNWSSLNCPTGCYKTLIINFTALRLPRVVDPFRPDPMKSVALAWLYTVPFPFGIRESTAPPTPLLVSDMCLCVWNWSSLNCPTGCYKTLMIYFTPFVFPLVTLPLLPLVIEFATICKPYVWVW